MSRYPGSRDRDGPSLWITMVSYSSPISSPPPPRLPLHSIRQGQTRGLGETWIQAQGIDGDGCVCMGAEIFGVFYCAMPKVACTTWRLWMRKVKGLPGQHPPHCDTWHHEVIMRWHHFLACHDGGICSLGHDGWVAPKYWKVSLCLLCFACVWKLDGH